MNRDIFQQLAQERLEDAKVLLDAGRYTGSYYLSGYVVECGLKACIAKKTQQYDFPPKLTNDIYTHNIDKLIKSSGLQTYLKKDLDSSDTSEDFKDNWAIVKDWNEEKRYSQHVTDKDAHDIYIAISDSKNGVLQWIKHYW